MTRQLADINSPNYFDLEDRTSLISLDEPRLTPSVHIALEDLNLEKIAVIYPGVQRYKLGDKAEAVPFEEVEGGMKGLFRIKGQYLLMMLKSFLI